MSRKSSNEPESRRQGRGRGKGQGRFSLARRSEDQSAANGSNSSPAPLKALIVPDPPIPKVEKAPKFEFELGEDDVEYIGGYGESSSSDGDLELVVNKQETKKELSISIDHQDQEKLERPSPLDGINPGVLTNTQFLRLEESLMKVQDFFGQDDLTQSQNIQAKIYLGNILEIKSKIELMIGVYLEDEEVCNNLILLMDRITENLKESLSNSSSEDAEPSQFNLEEKLSEYQSILSMSQIIDGDHEFALQLQAEWDRELHQVENLDAHPIPEPPPPPPVVQQLRGRRLRIGDESSSSSGSWSEKEEEKVEVEIPFEKVPMDDFIRELDRNKQHLNPFIQEFSGYPLDNSIHSGGMFTVIDHSFWTWAMEFPPVVQYLEIRITKIYPTFTPPFSFTAWQDYDSSSVGFTYELLDSLNPASITLMKSPPYLIHSTKLDEIKEGDVYGIGLLHDGDEFLFFGTKNGEMIHFSQLNRSDWHLHPRRYTQSSFRLMVTTGSVYKRKQLDFSVIDGVNQPFQFSMEFPKADCPICYDELHENLFYQLKSCSHSYCSSCLVGYLDNLHNEGKVLTIPCPNPQCEIPLSDHDLKKILPALKYGKFQQLRLLSQLRLDPNVRWCPVSECNLGVAADLNHVEFPKLTCVGCSHQFCYHCSLSWHEGISCRKAKSKIRSNISKRAKQEEVAFRRWQKENKTIRCTKCNVFVQRNEGCNHITCRCGHEFCWLCGETIYSAGSSFPLHYTTGACAGLQMSSADELSLTRKIVRVTIAPARAGAFVVAYPFMKVLSKV